jgi:hypothetical protein
MFTSATVETDVVNAAAAAPETLQVLYASKETVAASDTGASTSRSLCALTDADAVIVMAAPSNPYAFTPYAPRPKPARYSTTAASITRSAEAVVADATEATALAERKTCIETVAVEVADAAADTSNRLPASTEAVTATEADAEASLTSPLRPYESKPYVPVPNAVR